MRCRHDRTMTGERRRHGHQAKKGYLAATDVADYLAKKGLPFPSGPRDRGASGAHLRAARLRFGRPHAGRFQGGERSFRIRYREGLNLPAIVAARTTFGGTAPEAVRVQLAAAKAQLVGFGA